MIDAYNDFRDRLFDKLGNVGAIADFRGMMLALADTTARAMVNLNLGDRQLDELRGQLSLCYRIADDAEKALILNGGHANGQGG